MKHLTEHLKAVEDFILEHRPTPEIRSHLHILTEHFEMEDSLLDRIAKKDFDHAKIVETMSAEKSKVDRELSDLKAEIARRDSEDSDGFSGFPPPSGVL